MRSVLSMLLPLVAFPAAAANILVNPGFESGLLEPWVRVDQGLTIEPWNVSADTAHDGTRSATAVGNSALRQNFDPVLVLDIEEASVWAMMPAAGYSVMAIAWYYSNGEFGQAGFVPGATWTKYDVTSLLNPLWSLSGIAVFGCSGCDGGSRTYVDSAWIGVRDVPAEVPEPGALSLLFGSILAAVPFALKWRR